MDQQLWYHIVGTPQEDDKFIFAQPEHPTWFIGAEVTDDGRWASVASHGVIDMLTLLRVWTSPEAGRGCLTESCPQFESARIQSSLPGRSCCIQVPAAFAERWVRAANRLYYVDMAQLPRSSKLEALDFTLYDRR